MQRNDYQYAPLGEDQYNAILTSAEIFEDKNGNTILSPLHGTDNWRAADSACQPQNGNFDLRAVLSALLWEDHDGTDPGGGITLAKVYNFGGIKWANQPNAYDSGISVPANEGPGTYAGFHDFGGFVAEFIRTLNNQWCGPDFQSGDLVGAFAVYVGGPNNPNFTSGQNRVDTWRRYQSLYPSGGGSTVTHGSAVVAAAMNHLGDSFERDKWNGNHPVSMWCEADVEDWLWEATGVEPHHYVSAASAGDDGDLNQGPAPAGAQTFMRGSGWSSWDHTGVSLGDGRTISGLATVVVSEGWQVPSMGYRGWRWMAGVMPDVVQDVFYIDGNPFGRIPLRAPFWNRWNALNEMGLALPQLGYAKAPERTLPNGRRVLQCERLWLGTQDAPDPWDVVVLMPDEIPSGIMPLKARAEYLDYLRTLNPGVLHVHQMSNTSAPSFPPYEVLPKGYSGAFTVRPE